MVTNTSNKTYVGNNTNDSFKSCADEYPPMRLDDGGGELFDDTDPKISAYETQIIVLLIAAYTESK